MPEIPRHRSHADLRMVSLLQVTTQRRAGKAVTWSAVYRAVTVRTRFGFYMRVVCGALRE